MSRGGQPKDSGALQLAAGFGRLDIVKVLSDAGADIDEIPANAIGDMERSGAKLLCMKRSRVSEEK